MGKASKWILNFLIGKQEKKNEAKQCLPSTTKPTQPGIRKLKRRWSFRRSSHRVSKSVDTMDTTNILPLKPQQIHSFFVAREVENAAATRIQAAFRGHLARKALHALKGLVKLQALIRGHFVRKRTNATMKRMHALLSIQVRARLQRIEKAEVAAQVVNKKQSPIQRSFNQANEVHRKKIYMKYNESQRVTKSTSGYLNHSKPERVDDQGYTNIYPDRLSYSNRHTYNESLFTTPEISPRMPSPRLKPTRSSIPFRHHDSLVEPPIYDYSFMPSYMANTQSSRAKKVRSQSAPKQRPDGSTKHKYKHPELVHSTDEQFLRRSPSNFRSNESNDHIDHDPWFVKLYRPGRLFEDDNLDYINPCARHSISNYAESLVAEPPVVLY